MSKSTGLIEDSFSTRKTLDYIVGFDYEDLIYKNEQFKVDFNKPIINGHLVKIEKLGFGELNFGNKKAADSFMEDLKSLKVISYRRYI